MSKVLWGQLKPMIKYQCPQFSKMSWSYLQVKRSRPVKSAYYQGDYNDREMCGYQWLSRSCTYWVYVVTKGLDVAVMAWYMATFQ